MASKRATKKATVINLKNRKAKISNASARRAPAPARSSAPARATEPRDDVPKIGHNSANLTGGERTKLRGYIAELERIGAEIDELKAEQKEIYDAAGEANFDTRAMRVMVKERRTDKTKREAFAAVLDSYRVALGSLAGTPLGNAAMKRERRRVTAEEAARIEETIASTAEAPAGQDTAEEAGAEELAGDTVASNLQPEAPHPAA